VVSTRHTSCTIRTLPSSRPPGPENDVAPQTDDIDDELDADLVGEVIEDEELDDEDELPDGFVVEGEDVAEADDLDEGSTVDPAVDVVAEDVDDDFAEEPTLVVVATSDDDDEDIPVKRSGEFICTRCYLVKSNSQLANRKQKACRDCA
jgi:hypothetical protein